MKKNCRRLKKAVAAVEWLANCNVSMLAHDDKGEQILEKKFREFTLTNDVDILEVLPITAVGSGAVLDFARGVHREMRKFLKIGNALNMSIQVMLSADELFCCPLVVPCEIAAGEVRSFSSFCGWLAYFVERFNVLADAVKDFPKNKNKK